jgi:non-ribosomal peptide synthetase component F
VYGPTETTIWSSCFLLPRGGQARALTSIPIGSPVSETFFYLVTSDIDSAGQETLTLAANTGSNEGELCIGGVGVATGYLHALELSREKFIRNPFGEGVIYRTGDFVRKLEVP